MNVSGQKVTDDKPAFRQLEAVIVCDNYSDFLEVTIPHTLRNVNKLVVVTSKTDGDTKKLCAKLDVTCIEGWNHRRDGFDKARAINHGLAHLSCKNYLLHMDADVIIPDVFADWFTTSHILKPENIYGVDRYECKSQKSLDEVFKTGWVHARKEWRYMIQPPYNLKPSTRVAHSDYEGWLPIGYFQLWHGSQQTRYPLKRDADAEHTDVLFAANWMPENRILIPDFYAIHLSTDDGVGANWHGRKTPKWK